MKSLVSFAVTGILFAALLASFPIYAQDLDQVLNCRELTGKDLRLKVLEAKKKVEEFRPDKAQPAPINFKEIVFPEGPRIWGDVDGMGAAGKVRFGTYQGHRVAVKFIRADSFEPLSAEDSLAALWEEYFIGSVVADLGIAPKIFGYHSGPAAQKFAEEIGLHGNFTGVMLTEVIDPLFHPKSITGADKVLTKTQKLEQRIRRALKAVKDAGLNPGDLDYMVTRDRRFLFFDFGKWQVKNSAGIWEDGKFFDREYTDDNIGVIYEELFGIARTPKKPKTP